jgi:hypothetical protein
MNSFRFDYRRHRNRLCIVERLEQASMKGDAREKEQAAIAGPLVQSR